MVIEFLSTFLHLFFIPYIDSCSGLIMNCPPQVHVLNVWPPADGAILGGDGHFRMWGLAGGNRPLGECL
jgi:hypothetical protein